MPSHIDFLPAGTSLELKRSEPGPGKYYTIDNVGSKYYVSKFKNSGASSFIGKERFHS